MNQPAFHAVLLTPPGRGAIATIRVEGLGACDRVDSLFHAASAGSLADLPPDRLAFGRFRLAKGVYDEVIVRRAAADTVEIHCHGGPAVVERIMTALTAGGTGSRFSAGDWISESHASPIVSAARAALADATTLLTAAVLLDQFHGALDQAIREIITDLEHGKGSSGTVPIFTPGKWDCPLREPQRKILQLLAWAEFGRHLTRPWRVVLAGPPNAGKSSLINALVGYRRAIVHETPGTTRDLVTATTALEGWPVELCDTAGLRSARHPLERQGIDLAERELEAASLVLLVFDAAEPWSGENADLVGRYPDALIVHNKIDLARASLDSRPAGLPVSATAGEGVDDLITSIVRRLVPAPPEPGQAVPFLDHHVDVLAEAAEALARHDPAATVKRLNSLLDVRPGFES